VKLILIRHKTVSKTREGKILSRNWDTVGILTLYEIRLFISIAFIICIFLYFYET